MATNNQSGRTMLEMLGVIGIIGIITYGAISGINSGMTSYKVNSMYVEISDIIHGIQDMYLVVYGRGNFGNHDLNCKTSDYTAGCNTADANCSACKSLIDNGILSRNAVKGLEINVIGRSITIVYKADKKDFCKRLASMDWDVQSIDCKNNGPSCKSLNDNDLCNTSKDLTFSPK